MAPPRAIAVVTHSHPERLGEAIDLLKERCRERGVTLVLDPAEASRTGAAAEDGVRVADHPAPEVDLCLVLGGDGSILRALRLYARSDVAVFGINFGEVGFLATVEGRGEGLSVGLDAALNGRFTTLGLPALTFELANGSHYAFNDVAVHRRAGERVANLSYELDGEELGRVRCDGLVAATPAGSTGYNLANGGPVMAWGVEGFAVSFIAPHSLAARPLVVAPEARLSVINRSFGPLEVAVDGRRAGDLEGGARLGISYLEQAGRLAQLPGATFYRRLREKFGLLAS
jgi:NAD+ kinase